MGAEQLGAAFAESDIDTILSLTTDDVVFHSPVIEEPGFEGKESFRVLLEVVRENFGRRTLVHALEGPGTHAFVYDVDVLGKQARITLLAEVDDAGLVREIWATARPLVGAAAIVEAVGTGLVRRRSRGLSSVLRVSVKPLAGMAATASRVGGRLIGDLNRETGALPQPRSSRSGPSTR